MSKIDKNIFAEMKERNGKIPIKIEGWNNFALLCGIDDFTLGTFCFGGCGITLDEVIHELIEWFNIKAKIYLKRMALGKNNGEDAFPGQYQDIAFKIVNYKGNLENLFYLEYEKCWQEKVEPQLGRFADLERKVR
jgi:hypothetical protein